MRLKAFRLQFGTFGRGNGAREHHSAGGSLVQAEELDFNFFADALAGMIDDHHGAVFEIGDALVDTTTGGDDFYLDPFAGKIFVAEDKRQLVQVQRIDMLGGGDFLEVKIVGQD